MKPLSLVGPAIGAVIILVTSFWVRSQVDAAGYRLANPDAAAPAPAVADHAEAAYCTPEFKKVLQRVLNACGLVGTGSRRGCKPSDVKSIASISDEDFNALFLPLQERGGIVMFDEGKDTLDPGAKQLVEDRWSDRRGARYFFIVARGSQTGTVERNRIVSHKRANSVFFHISELSKDPDLEKQVGMLWLGKEFAQLPKEFCTWRTSHEEAKKCDEQVINRSAFISWVDCRL
jgi:outer membrane protein OmpA-like peptidoglycan-associated protein